MKKFGRYLRNPPVRRQRKAAKRVVRKRNPVPYAFTAVNPRKKKKRTRRNPLELQHVIVERPNPRKKTRHKNRKKNSFTMSTRKRSRRKSRRNPHHRTRRRSHSRRRSNPRRRHKSFLKRLRNPAIISELTSKDVIKAGATLLVGVGGTNYVLNMLIQGDATGKRMFDLPGVTYSTATAPLTPAQFQEVNKVALGFYRTLIPCVFGYIAEKWDGVVSKAFYASAIFNAGSAFLNGTDVGRKAGLGTYIPDVPAILSGPATFALERSAGMAAFNPRLGTGAFLPRQRGMNASVTRQWANKSVNGVADPFVAN